MPAPQRLGKYEIRREIGKGSMGIVYEGFDPLIQRSVAVKVIRENDLDATMAAELRARLRREAQAAGRLNHPNIVAIYDYGEAPVGSEGDVAYIAMELAEGRELKASFDAQQRFAPREIERIMLGILAALQHAHERGVTHRDVKPANVMLLPDGRVKVADFGVARMEASDLTQAGSVIGTPQYMSPEQVMGYAVDGRSDLFACGVILYQFLTGEKPFTGSVTTVMQKVLNEEPVPPTQRNPTLKPEWDLLLRRALAKKPADRFQTADEFAAALREAVAAQGQNSSDATLVLPNTVDITLPGAVAAPRAGRARGIGMAVGALALGAAGLAAYVLMPSHQAGVLPLPPLPAVVVQPAVSPAVVAALPEPPAPAASIPSASAPLPPVALAKAPAVIPRAAATKPPTPTAAPTPEAQAPPPKPTDNNAGWPQRLAALEAARGPLTLGGAMVLLLDVRSADERRLLAELDAALAQAPQHSALAMGVSDGLFVNQLQINAPKPGGATSLALRRCSERGGTPCQVVLANGEFRKGAFVDVARGLNSRTVASVRETTLRSATARLEGLRQPVTQAQAPVATPPMPAPTPNPAPPSSSIAEPPLSPSPSSSPSSSPPPAPPVTAAPVNEWREALQRLQARQGRLGIAEGLALLLGVQSAPERKTLDDFEAALKRLRWKSAMAIGEKNGFLVYRYQWGNSSNDGAEGSAMDACAQSAGRACALVMSDGRFIEAGLLQVATQLGPRRQSAVRDSLITDIQRKLLSGL